MNFSVKRVIILNWVANKFYDKYILGEKWAFNGFMRDIYCYSNCWVDDKKRKRDRIELRKRRTYINWEEFDQKILKGMRKNCMNLNKQHVSTIPQKYYVYFLKDFTKILEQKILNRLIKKLGKLLQILQEKWIYL